MRALVAIRDRFWARTRPALSRLVYANGGIGDELMLTAIARAARGMNQPLHILSNSPEIWSGNDDPASVQTGVDRWFYARRRGWIATDIVHLSYTHGVNRHIAVQMAEKAGVHLPEGWRPVYPVGLRNERNERMLLLQNSCRGARYAATTKEWAQSSWRELTARLQHDFELIQIGTVADPVLPYVRDLRGRTTLREAAKLIAKARGFIGLESGLMHLAAAVQTPAVIIYGGRTSPSETGYTINCNITRTPACGGCALNQACPHNMTCMDISVAEVETAIRRIFSPEAPSPNE